MDCDICGAEFGPKLPCHCPTCARTSIYPLRIEVASALINKEQLNRHVQSVAQADNNGTGQTISLSGVLIDKNETAKKTQYEDIQTQTVIHADNTGIISERVDLLRQDAERLRGVIRAKKVANARLRSDLSSANHDISSRRDLELDKVQKVIRRTERRSDQLHIETVKARVYLCREAANLAGLKMSVRKAKDGSKQDVYSIGGVRICDLRELNNISPRILTASLTQVAQLLIRVSHYLAIRLPAEITLPHRNYPLPTIFAPSSSYQHRNVPFPGATPSHSSSNSPSGSRTLDNRQISRPRPLFLDQKLPQLLKEDPAAFALFIEGITLLAWNIAWLCRAQGAGDFNQWEDVCNIGKNLWCLLSEQEATGPSSLQSENGRRASPAQENSGTPVGRSLNGFGRLSHGTAHTFLGGASGVEQLRGWKLQTPAKVKDAVKACLLAEMQGAEWELVDGLEALGMEDDMAVEEPVVVGTGQTKLDTRRALSTVIEQSVASPAAEAATDTTGEIGRGGDIVAQEPRNWPLSSPSRPSANGWTKLKSRSHGETSTLNHESEQ